MRDRSERRHNDWKKAIRKRRITRDRDPRDKIPWYTNLHRYSKNKIHCSCPLCRCKSNNPRESMNWPISDLKKLEDMEDQIKEMEA